MALLKSSMSTKKTLTFLGFVAICFSFQGMVMVYRHERSNHQSNFFNSLAAPSSYDMEQEKAKALKYVQQFKSNQKRSLKFFHVPKAAGTAIEHVAGEQEQLAWGSCLFNHKPKRDICTYPEDSIEWPRNYGWWHLPAQLFPMARSNPYQGAELFAIVRDPFDRLVSEVCMSLLFIFVVFLCGSGCNAFIFVCCVFLVSYTLLYASSMNHSLYIAAYNNLPLNLNQQLLITFSFITFAN